MSVPASSDVVALQRYLSQAYAAPVLSAAEEARCMSRFKQYNDANAARTLVLSHVRFVVHIAKKYQGFGMQLADLIQEGTVGLMKAIHRFDPALGARLASFAVHWIKSAIHEYILKNWRLVKIATTKAQRKLFFNLHRFLNESNAMNDEDVRFVADTLAVPEKEVRHMELRMRGGSELSVAPVLDEDQPVTEVVLSGAQQYEPEHQVIQEDFLNRRDTALHYALSQLDPRSQDIIQQRWLSEQKMTFADLADRYQVSAERVRQLEKLAFKKLQTFLTGHAELGQDAKLMLSSLHTN